VSLAVVLVHYHAATYLADAVAALRRDPSFAALDTEIIVVDNGSHPDERAVIDALAIRYVNAGGNRGYAGGVNLGAEHTNADRFLLMNPDVEVRPGCVGALLEHLDNGAAAAGPRFYWDRDCTLLLPPTEVRTRRAELLRAVARRDPRVVRRARASWRRHARRHWQASDSVSSLSLSGALLAVRRDAWTRVGPFDPQYQLYFEENDWLARAQAAGLRTFYVPAATAIHHYNRSASSEPRAAAWFEESSRTFSARHYGAWFARLHQRMPSWGGLERLRDTLPFVDWRRSSANGHGERLWIEISPASCGFPAASGVVALDRSTWHDWRPSAELLAKIDPGRYSIRLVDSHGQELGAREFDAQRPDAGPTSTTVRTQSAVALAILKRRGDEHRHSAELTFADSWLTNQARRVFGDTWLVPCGEHARAVGSIPEAPYVLLASSSAVVCTERTLRLLKRALDDGASAAVPSPLAMFPQHLDPPPFSLRDYDRIESRIIDDREPPQAASTVQIPICLCTRSFFLTLLQRFSLETLLSSPCDLRELFPAERIDQTGLYYPFNDYYGETRRDVVPHLPAGAREILDIGCGRGLTGQYLEAELGCRVTGIELNPAVAEDARTRVSRVLVGDVLSMDIDGTYGAIIATELVEHLGDPEILLRRLPALLKPGGRIVLSIPNVGHHSVVSDLMTGRWDYLAAGLLCWTHVRFYTYRTLVDLLERSGLEHFRIVRQQSPLPAHVSSMLPARGADVSSLRTHGFWVIIDRDPEQVGPFVVRPAGPSDERSINDGFNQIFGLARRLDEWQWKFQAGTDSNRSMVAVRADQQLVAHFGLQRVELQVNGQHVIAGHAVDGFCRPDPDANRLQLYVRTVRAACARYGGSELAFLYGFPGKRAMALGRHRLGFDQPIDVPVWRRSTSGDEHASIPPEYAVAPTCRRADADDIWQRAAHRYVVSPLRNGGWLHRRYLDRPRHEYRAFTVFERQTPRAWGILHIQGQVGQVVDLVWDGEDARALIALDRTIGATANAAGADRLELWLSGDGLAADVLTTNGWKRGTHDLELQMTTVRFDATFDRRTLLENFYLTMGIADLV
jgi:GT2 family glycosyltransferase/SAM-dependent methyltransferase